jgi:hypothetical protein
MFVLPRGAECQEIFGQAQFLSGFPLVLLARFGHLQLLAFSQAENNPGGEKKK